MYTYSYTALLSLLAISLCIESEIVAHHLTEQSQSATVSYLASAQTRIGPNPKPPRGPGSPRRFS